MKRLTIAMGEDLYGRLLGYAADQSKSQMKRLSLGLTMRTLVSTRLDELGYEMPLEVAPRISSKRSV
jgi:hypothetical protein